MTTHVTKKTVLCPFGGGGGGARGFQQARARLFGHDGTFDLLGGFDNDPYACKAFEYLTGVAEVCIDARELTPGMMREFFGEAAPFCIHGSPPCQGSSKLLSTAKSKLPKYELLNELTLLNVRLILETWPDDLPAFILLENVPNITSRAKALLREVRRLLLAAGYKLQDGFHECRHVGDLAQRRKRWFLVARHPAKVPAFLYFPPKKKGKVCGDVLSEMPLPGAPEGGAMHRLPAISAMNWWRLWKIPAGGDWRDLRDDEVPRRAIFRRHLIADWMAPTATIGGPGSNGPCAVADPRDAAKNAFIRWERDGIKTPGHVHWFKGEYGVTAWGEPCRAVIGGMGNGAGYVADPISAPERFHHVERVTRWDEASGSITHAPAPSSGAISVADPRFPGALGVLSLSEASGAITCEAYPGTGRFSLADDIGRWFPNVLGVLPAGALSAHITSNATSTTGRVSYAYPRFLSLNLSSNAHLNLYRVTAGDEPVGVITGATRPGNGAASYAAPLDLVPQASNAQLHFGKYVVRPWSEEAQTVTGAGRVGSGAQSIAQPLNLAVDANGFHAGAGIGKLGVLAPVDPSMTITGNARIATGPFSVSARVPIDFVPGRPCFDRGYAVIDREHEPSHAIAGTSSVGCGTYAITDKLPLEIGCSPRAGAYGVVAAEDAAHTVTGSANIDNSSVVVADPRRAPPPYVILSYEEARRVADGEVAVPFAIVDPERADEPLAIVDDMAKPPFRWAVVKGKRRREPVPLVLVSADGTWHRPLTTLELARLQGLPWKVGGAALDFTGGATAARKLIGNMVPPPVGLAMGEQMLLAGLAADAGSFFLTNGGAGIWVEGWRRKDFLQRGVRAIRPCDIEKIAPGEVVILDDEAKPIRRRGGRRPRAHVGFQAAQELQPQTH